MKTVAGRDGRTYDRRHVLAVDRHAGEDVQGTIIDRAVVT